MNRTRLYISSPADRDTVLMILGRNDYTVRQGREKQGNRTLSYVEYWKEGKNGDRATESTSTD